ncbi:hypothetical protein JCM19239_2138 [Vibrio variabilis]|uniref:Uncharacterized protein n=1 Tax=Vibrio variabilis TaxID=990271 RepID=A0ABQ0JJH9_9VIBR|nr:hypothetical protein JCM19239_2138 [Vibrio variabilis]
MLETEQNRSSLSQSHALSLIWTISNYYLYKLPFVPLRRM